MNASHNLILIPAYEPGQSLLELLRDLSGLSCDHDNCHTHDGSHNLSCGRARDTTIIVVDDGSGPNYTQIFDEARSHAIVLTHKENRGKGAALKTGLSYIEKTHVKKSCSENSCNEKSSIKEYFDPDSVIVTMDADGQHRTEDAMKICAVAACPPAVMSTIHRRASGLFT